MLWRVKSCAWRWQIDTHIQDFVRGNLSFLCWRWRQMRRWFWLEYYTGTKRVCMQLLNAHMLMGKKKKHLLIMLTKHNYANCHHNYMCTSRWNYSQLLSNCEASPNLCYTFITRCNHFFCCILLVNKHFHEHAITVVPKTWEVQC